MHLQRLRRHVDDPFAGAAPHLPEMRLAEVEQTAERAAQENPLNASLSLIF